MRSGRRKESSEDFCKLFNESKTISFNCFFFPSLSRPSPFSPRYSSTLNINNTCKHNNITLKTRNDNKNYEVREIPNIRNTNYKLTLYSFDNNEKEGEGVRVNEFRFLFHSSHTIKTNFHQNSLNNHNYNDLNVLGGYIDKEKEKRKTLQEQIKMNTKKIIEKIKETIKKGYLPYNYPHSVSESYKRYQIYWNLQQAASSVCYVLATESLLTSIGLHNGVALGISASINWILKDGLSSLSKILFACTKLISQNIDQNPKQSIVIGSLLIFLGTSFEMITCLFPISFFLLITTAANIIKSAGLLVLNSSKAIIFKDFAKNQNLADVTAKSFSQSTTSHFIGVFCAIFISLFCKSFFSFSFSLFLPFFIFGSFYLLFGYYQAKCLVMNTLTSHRSLFLLDHYFLCKLNTNKQFSNQSTNNIEEEIRRKSILSPKEISEKEKIPFRGFSFSDCKVNKFKVKIITGNDEIRNSFNYSDDNLAHHFLLFGNQNYFITYKDKQMFICFSDKITSTEEFKSLFHYFYLNYSLANENINLNENDKPNEEKVKEHLIHIHNNVQSEFIQFQQILNEIGWSLSDINLSSLK